MGRRRRWRPARPSQERSTGVLAKAVAGEMASPLLDVASVTLRYKTPRAVVTATERVSFQVHTSDRLVLLGPSGCGKSTLLKAVGGYMRPSEGTITIKGRQVTEPGPDRMMVFQEFDQLLPWKTVLENVTFPLSTRVGCRGARRPKRRGTISTRCT